MWLVWWCVIALALTTLYSVIRTCEKAGNISSFDGVLIA
jgi:hypothetical protein